MDQILKIKNEGNDFFNKNQFEQARDKYIQAIAEIDGHLAKNEKTLQKEMLYLRQQIQLNVAAALLELKQYETVVQITSDIIKENPKSIKSYFRRGLAQFELFNVKEANNDLKIAYQLNPGNPEIKKAINNANQRLLDPIFMQQSMLAENLGISSMDPYIYDPLLDQSNKDNQKNQQQYEEEQKQNEEQNKQKIFQLSQPMGLDPTKAKQNRKHFRRSVDMLKKSLEMDYWEYIDDQIIEEFGFSKLPKDQWNILFGLYQSLLLYTKINVEDLHKNQQDKTMVQLFDSQFGPEGWFYWRNRKLRNLYYTKFKEFGIQI